MTRICQYSTMWRYVKHELQSQWILVFILFMLTIIANKRKRVSDCHCYNSILELCILLAVGCKCTFLWDTEAAFIEGAFIVLTKSPLGLFEGFTTSFNTFLYEGDNLLKTLQARHNITQLHCSILEHFHYIHVKGIFCDKPQSYYITCYN